MNMKRIAPIIIIFIALVVVAIGTYKPWIGAVTESWEAQNDNFKIRVERRAENCLFLCGAYYIFQSSPASSDSWREIMTFRHDDSNPIPRDQVRFVNDRIGYVFMGWKYSVTTDGGATWSIWDATNDLPNWECCNYGLIKDVLIAPDGTGVMTLNPISQRRGEVPELHTKDFGQHWNP